MTHVLVLKPRRKADKNGIFFDIAKEILLAADAEGRGISIIEVIRMLQVYLISYSQL